MGVGVGGSTRTLDDRSRLHMAQVASSNLVAMTRVRGWRVGA